MPPMRAGGREQPRIAGSDAAPAAGRPGTEGTGAGRQPRGRLRLNCGISWVGWPPVSTPRTLRLPDGVRRVTVETARGPFAALEALPAAGVAERQPALLIPGYTGSKEDFLPVLGPLAQAGRRVTAIDMRGQYESPAAADADGYRLPALAADVAMIADTLTGPDGPAAAGGPQRIHLLGHSFGGLVARELLLAQAAQIGSLTLMSSGPGALTGPRAAVLRAVLAELEPVSPGRARRRGETALGHPARAGRDRRRGPGRRH